MRVKMKNAKANVKSKIFETIRSNWKQLHPDRGFSPGRDYIPYAGRIFGVEEVISLVDASIDFLLTGGPVVESFETRLAEYIGVSHCLAVNSGSSANLLALFTLTSSSLGDKSIRPGDEVITTAACFPTTVAPIVQAGCLPVFVDVEPGKYNPSIEMIKNALSEKTKAVFIAHTLGNPVAAAEVRRFCDDNDLWFVEDNCDSLGSEYDGKRTGSFGHLSTCSFYPAHHITTGEGGAVFTSNPILAKVAFSLRDWGKSCWCKPGEDNSCGKRFSWKLDRFQQGYDHKYIFSHLGFNLKMTEMQAAIGMPQLDRLEDFVAKRRKNFEFFRCFFHKYNEVFVLPEPTPRSRPSWFGFPLLIKPEAGFSRNEIINYLEKHNVATRLLFAGNIIWQPAFDGVKFRISENLHTTESIAENLFWIGVYPGIDEQRREYIVGLFTTFLNAKRTVQR
jgi:CDP-4-dehydro-6-deoxyglucose reductase, E1